MAQRFRVPNWRRFQYYSHRNPPWIRLHHSILTDRAFCSLPLASQGLLMQIWVLASENEGEVNCDPEELSFRLHKKIHQKDVEPLVGKFLICIDEPVVLHAAASACISETETETETETEVSKKIKATNGHAENVEQVISFWQEAGLSGDPRRFFDQFEARGWKTREGPLRSWQHAARNWSRNSIAFGEAGRAVATPGKYEGISKEVKV